jgi:NADPH:quinone reductase-like Zn-dependent oxidoreductase
MFAGQTAALFNTKDNEDDLGVLRGLLESGSLVPVTDRSYRLGEAADAFRHLETGHARGKIIIAM